MRSDGATIPTSGPSLQYPAGAQIEGCGIIFAERHTQAIQTDMNDLQALACALTPRDCVRGAQPRAH